MAAKIIFKLDLPLTVRVSAHCFGVTSPCLCDTFPKFGDLFSHRVEDGADCQLVLLPWSLSQVSWFAMGSTAAIRPSESLLGITAFVMLVVVVLVPAVIRSGGWLVFVSTSWAAAACPRVLGIVFVDSDQNEAPLLLFSGRGRGVTSPSYYGRDVDGQGGSTLFSASMFFSRSSGVVLLSCHLSFFTDWPYL